MLGLVLYPAANMLVLLELCDDRFECKAVTWRWYGLESLAAVPLRLERQQNAGTSMA